MRNNTELFCGVGAQSESEVQEIMDAHQRELADTMRRQDRERDDQMAALRKKLAERRRKREQEMRSRHAQEVKTKIIWYNFFL